MPAEIADSDAESDYDDEPQQHNAPLPVAGSVKSTPAQESQNSLDIDFDEFITQSGGNASQIFDLTDEPSKPSTGSTEKLLRGIEETADLLARSSSIKTLSAVKTQQTRSLPSPTRDIARLVSRNGLNDPECSPRGQLDGSPSETSRKRRYTDTQSPNGQNGEIKKNKRAKTYGNTKGHRPSNQGSISGSDVGPPNGTEHVPEEEQPTKEDESRLEPTVASNETELLSMPPPAAKSTANEEDAADGEDFVRQRRKPREAFSLLHDNPLDSAGKVYTSRSSMGGHESINIDLRHSSDVTDVHANPFGNPSQDLRDDDCEEEASFSGEFDNKTMLVRPLPGFEDHRETEMSQGSNIENDCPGDFGNARGMPNSVDPSILMYDSSNEMPNDTQLLSSSPFVGLSKRLKTSHPQFDILSQAEPLSGLLNGAANDGPPLKERGRKPKNQRATSIPLVQAGYSRDELLSDEAAIDLPKEQYNPKPNRSCTNTTEANTEAEQVLVDTSTVTKKGKRKRTKSDRPLHQDQEIDTNSPAKHHSSELNLSDEAFIGLPKENYNPRPSHSRRGTTESVNDEPLIDQSSPRKTGEGKENHLHSNDSQREEHDQSSPLKPATSEFNLSDEVAIGLPKENYKPRPSRSRSKRTVDEEDVVSEPVPDEIPNDRKAEKIESPPKSEKKRGKKTKVKRAKTSAAALLKSQKMFSDGEDDMIFMDEQPAKVKLDLPSDLKLEKALKLEEESKMRLPEENPIPAGEKEDPSAKEVPSVETEAGATKVSKANFSVEIPLPPAARQDPVPEPKKRGRKPKKKAEVAKEEEVAEEPDKPDPELNEDSADPSSQSKTLQPPILTERDVNISMPANNSNAFKPNMKTNTPSPQKPTVESTPTKHTSSASASRNGGPTKHSPIASLSAPLTKYRVGLSRRAAIPSLLKKVGTDKSSLPPTVAPSKRKKKEVEVEPEEEEERDDDEHQKRDADGMGAMRRNPETGLLEEYISD